MWPSRAPHTATEDHKTGFPHKSHAVTPVLCQRPPPRDCCARASASARPLADEQLRDNAVHHRRLREGERRGEEACGGGTGEMRRLSSPYWEGGCPDIPDPVDFIVLVVLYLYGDNNFLDKVLVLVYTVHR